MSIQKSFLLNGDFIHFPVKKGAEANYVQFIMDGETRHEFHLELSDADSDFYVFMDVRKYKGKELILRVENPVHISAQALERFINNDQDCMASNELYPSLYAENHRPQFHFTSRRGWLNDPNGLVYHNGVYHMFYQHNPFGIRHGGVNVSWGHAVSDDLVRWRELSDAVYPNSKYTHIASGGAIIDHDNTAGFGKEAMVLSYTSLGSLDHDHHESRTFPSDGQYLAYSLDHGATFEPYGGNPVIPCRESWRDPRIVWYAPQNKWVMTVYEYHHTEDCIAFYESTDLKEWKLLSILAGLYECPDFFELQVKGDPSLTKWVLYGADGRYLVGDFDGRVFAASSDTINFLDYGNIYYAAQTWSNVANHLENAFNIAWLRSEKIGLAEEVFSDMPFNQQMTVVTKLELVNTSDGYRLDRYPVEGIKALRSSEQEAAEAALVPGVTSDHVLGGPTDMEFELTVEEGTSLEITFSDITITYSSLTRKVDFGNNKEVSVYGSGLNIRLLVDVASVELFINEGQGSASYSKVQDEILSFGIREGSAKLKARKWRMESIWK